MVVTISPEWKCFRHPRSALAANPHRSDPLAITAFACFHQHIFPFPLITCQTCLFSFIQTNGVSRTIALNQRLSLRRCPRLSRPACRAPGHYEGLLGSLDIPSNVMKVPRAQMTYSGAGNSAVASRQEGNEFKSRPGVSLCGDCVLLPSAYPPVSINPHVRVGFLQVHLSSHSPKTCGCMLIGHS